MEKQILELLLELKQEVKEMNNRIDKLDFNMNDKIDKLDFNMNDKIDKLDFNMKDGFETLEIKIDEVDLKLRKSNKKLSDQIALNMESIESLKQ